MEPIFIPQLLKAPQQTETLALKVSLPDFPTLTPIQGTLRVRHCGDYLEVGLQTEAIVTLSCDRCLQQYNHRLVCETSELIWLHEPEAEAYAVEIEVAPEDLVESLPPAGYFDPQDWLYQQLCLALPQQQLCDLGCPGILAQPAPITASKPVDRRWAALEALAPPTSSTP
jgi:uncharacterized protein